MRQENDWHLIQCKANESFRAYENLSRQGFECFHPTHKIKKNVAGKLTTTVAPLFPFYLFAKPSPNTLWSKVRSTKGVLKVVTFGGIPASLSDEFVQNLKNYSEALHLEGPKALFKPGDRVVISDGPFKEIEAIVHNCKDDERVILLLNLCQKEHKLMFDAGVLKIRA